MRIVEKAVKPPGMCLLSRDTEGPFFDPGLYARHRDPYMYVSVRWVEDRARELGMVPGREIEELESELRNMLAGYVAKVEQLEKFVEAHETLVESAASLADGEGI